MRGLSEEERCKILPEGLVLAGYRGSISHGMWRPNTHPNSIDDKDIIGTFIGPIESYFGLTRVKRGPKPWERTLREWDVVAYELRHFVHLLLKSNPNVLCLLWLSPKHYIVTTDMGSLLIQNRNMFVSKAAFYSFSGYAKGQLHRMTHYAFEGYMGEKRKKLVQKYGYDCKNASHLIRLLRMGIEFLTDGELHVERQDATQLLEIKSGEWTLERVKKEAERLFILAEEAHVRSSLPAKPDREGAEALLVAMLKEHFHLSRIVTVTT